MNDDDTTTTPARPTTEAPEEDPGAVAHARTMYMLRGLVSMMERDAHERQHGWQRREEEEDEEEDAWWQRREKDGEDA